MLAAVLVLGHHVAARSLREGVFLGTFSVAQLPKAMLGAAVAAIPMALLVARWMERFGPGRLTPLLFVLSAFGSFAEWWLLPLAPQLVAIALYLHVSIGSALLVSAFWSIINERFDPHTLKNVVGRIGGASTFGGLLGGLGMERVTHWLSARTSLIVIGLVALGAAACTQRLGATLIGTKVPTAAEKRPDERLTGYLRTLAFLVACVAAVSAFGDFALKQAAVARFSSSTESLVRFFAVFYTAAALAGFLLQTLVSRRLLDTIGVGGTLCVPPLIGVGLGVLALVSPSLLTIGALRGADLSLGPSLYRTAFEPLFTPVAAASKRRAKALIDVVFDKGGETLASSIILGLLMAGPLIVQRAPPLLAAACSALAVVLSLRAQRGYVVELEASLRAGTLNADIPDPDNARRLLLSATTLGTDRGQLLEQITRLRQAKSDIAETTAAPRPPREPAEQVVSHVRVLLGTDTRAIRELLALPQLDHRLAAFVVPLLGSNELAKPAVNALRQMGESAFGALADAMYSSHNPAAVRRRIPHVLRNARGERVVRTLFFALSADSIEVRYRAALALAEVVKDDKKLLPDRSQIEALVLTELARGPLDQTGLNHVFALLALTMHRGSLELARQGLLSQDRKLRGTALEYLESLLSETVRAPLLSALAELAGPRERATAPLPDSDLLEELRRSFQADIAPPTLATDPD
jgi:MFS family permease